MNVYKLPAELRSLLSVIDEGGEVPPELLELLDKKTAEVPDFVNTLFKLIRTSNVNALAARGEISYLQKKARAWDSAKDKFKEHLKKFLEDVLHVKSYPTDLCNPTVCDNPPSVQLADDVDIEKLLTTKWSHLVDVEVSLNGDKVRQAANQEGGLPPGIEVKSSGTHLRI